MLALLLSLAWSCAIVASVIYLDGSCCCGCVTCRHSGQLLLSGANISIASADITEATCTQAQCDVCEGTDYVLDPVEGQLCHWRFLCLMPCTDTLFSSELEITAEAESLGGGLARFVVTIANRTPGTGAVRTYVFHTASFTPEDCDTQRLLSFIGTGVSGTPRCSIVSRGTSITIEGI